MITPKRSVKHAQLNRTTRACLAILMSIGLTGCATADPPPPVQLRPYLPTALPTFGEPVPVPVPRVGQDARDYAARAVAGLRIANNRLEMDRVFWEAVAREFSA